jgi:hypothetical protein
VVGSPPVAPERTTMAKQPKNHGKSWTPSDNKALRQLASQNTPTRVIGLKMGRTPDAVQTHASDIGVSLKPTNQSPYGTKKK